MNDATKRQAIPTLNIAPATEEVVLLLKYLEEYKENDKAVASRQYASPTTRADADDLRAQRCGMADGVTTIAIIRLQGILRLLGVS